jgi:hypothetical protein
LALAATCLLSCQSAKAIVDAFSRTNTSAPADGAPWANVVGVNSESGVYIGGGWVLTAAHVGAGNVNFEGVVYPYDGNSHRLTNSNGTVTDLLLFHLSMQPPIPSIPLATSTPAARSQVDMIGFGAIAGSDQTSFGSYTGFSWSSSPYKSWGNNKANSGTSTVNIGFGNLTVFKTDFTAPGTGGLSAPTSDEAQAASGDSGGGVFQLNGSIWQLVGILDAISMQSGQQPGTAVYGNTTASADIATYRNQIIGVITPATAPGLAIVVAGASVTACWPDDGVTYQLQAASSLTSSNWSTLDASVTATNGQLCVWLPTTNTLRVFRLKR